MRRIDIEHEANVKVNDNDIKENEEVWEVRLTQNILKAIIVQENK